MSRPASRALGRAGEPAGARLSLVSAQPRIGHHVSCEQVMARLDRPGTSLLLELGRDDSVERPGADGHPAVFGRVVQFGPGVLLFDRGRFEVAVSHYYRPGRGAFMGAAYVDTAGMVPVGAAELGRPVNHSAPPHPPAGRIVSLSVAQQLAAIGLERAEYRRGYGTDDGYEPDPAVLEEVELIRALAARLGLPVRDDLYAAPEPGPAAASVMAARPEQPCPGHGDGGGTCAHYDRLPDEAELAAVLPVDGQPFTQSELIIGLFRARGCRLRVSHAVRGHLSRQAATWPEPGDCAPGPHVHTAHRPGGARTWWRCAGGR
jgi:hypothetical protein